MQEQGMNKEGTIVSDSPHTAILRRKAKQPPVRRPRDAAGDLWRRILPRLAADGLGLQLAVSGVTEQTVDLHAELAAEDGALLLFLADAYGGPGGLAVADAPLVTALVEVQTTGRVSSARRDPRRPTAVDAALVRHALDGWFAGLADARGEVTAPSVWGQAPDVRAALLKLEEGRWTETQVDLDLGGGKRAGRLTLFVPLPAEVRRDTPPTGLSDVVLPVEAVMDAVLCRVRLPLQSVLTFAPGQAVPLPGVSVRRIALEAPMGRPVAQVHLGQSRGFRAVRILPPDAGRDAPAAHHPAPRPTGEDLLPHLASGTPNLAAPGLPPLPGADLPPLPQAGLPDIGLPPLSP
jgi:flagellar motor switch protein FliM